jgi:hypothetical protein
MKKLFYLLSLLPMLPVLGFGQAILSTIATPAGNPPTGYVFNYNKTGSIFCVKNSTGTEVCIPASALTMPLTFSGASTVPSGASLAPSGTGTITATAAAVSGAAVGLTGGNPGAMLYCLATSLTGAQTVAVAWAAQSGFGDTAAQAIAISATGVNQTTPYNNGTETTNSATASSVSLTVTSTSGGLTSTFIEDLVGDPTTNQTQKAQVANGGYVGSQDIGPGTGTTTHTWSASFTSALASLVGANFNPPAAAERCLACDLSLLNWPKLFQWLETK